nr:tetraacyldisaccharide 4'-kinase [Oceanococcus sp. HetDA_MAG_MS8]
MSLRSFIESQINQRWYARQPGWLWLFWPLEWIYAAVVVLRRKAYQQGWLNSKRCEVPVVVVGNIVAGGAGKTPVIIALAKALRDRGWNVGVVSRGYGRRTRGLLWVGAQSTAAEVGDEPLLIAQQTACSVVVAEERYAAAQELEKAGCNLILADDGLQHYALARDVEIVVTPAARGDGNGHLLPVGPLREPAWRREQAHLQLSVGDQPAQTGSMWTLQPKPGDLIRLGDARRVPLATFQGQDVFAVAAIGHPQGFFSALDHAGLKGPRKAFADHHQFTVEDFSAAANRPILMTAKDAVKCRFLHGREAYSLEYFVTLPAGLLTALEQCLPAQPV